MIAIASEAPLAPHPMTKNSPLATKPLGVWRQRFGYGIADFASNLVWQVITLYLMFFYTDVIGLVAAQVGIIFLIARLVDGVADVSMGLIIDKTQSKWGKSRPWFLWGAFPFGFFGIATFYVPKMGHTSELVYAFITYLGLSIVYTVVNIPLSSILPSLTRDPQERTNLATVRIVLAILGSTLVSICTLPMVKILGGDNRAAGFLWTMVIFAVTGTSMFIFTFFNVEEKYTVRQDHMTIKKAFSALKGNTPWYIFAVNIVFMWGAYLFS
jgi:glycoside/pentoside/hexuronide:cation symporter, GPH family